jgi:hypothetical protein
MQARLIPEQKVVGALRQAPHSRDYQMAFGRQRLFVRRPQEHPSHPLPGEVWIVQVETQLPRWEFLYEGKLVEPATDENRVGLLCATEEPDVDVPRRQRAYRHPRPRLFAVCFDESDEEGVIGRRKDFLVRPSSHWRPPPGLNETHVVADLSKQGDILYVVPAKILVGGRSWLETGFRGGSSSSLTSALLSVSERGATTKNPRRLSRRRY